MSTEAIAALLPHDEVPGALPALRPSTATAPGVSFGQLVSDGLQGVNQKLMVSQVDLQQLALGEAPNLHEVMIRLEESRISFQLAMQVRNRLLEAYQEVMRMQV
ncbi:MAG: flagellar hook-basal body complex protein FliE [Comamonadaceae bacterium]|nr:MAG: flagellar hook-basal body complex protein FliE [Comamonadaceae bacterium]